MHEGQISQSDVEAVLTFKPYIVDIRDLPEKWVCEINDKHWFADTGAHCPFCGKDLRYEKYHENHYREKRFYEENK